MKTWEHVSERIKDYCYSATGWGIFQWKSEAERRHELELSTIWQDLKDEKEVSKWGEAGEAIRTLKKRVLDEEMRAFPFQFLLKNRLNELHHILLEAEENIEEKIADLTENHSYLILNEHLTLQKPVSEPVAMSYVLIVTDRYNDGYGDLFFALKLARGIQNQINLHAKPWKVIVTSTDAVNETLRVLADSNGYDVEILNRDALAGLAQANPIEMIIGGPVYLPRQEIANINQLLRHQSKRVPWIFLPEYGFSRKTREVDWAVNELKIVYEPSHFDYYGVMESGFSEGSMGVFSSGARPEGPDLIDDALRTQLNEISGMSSEAMPDLFEYSITYCNHDHDQGMPNCNEHFLFIHASYAKINPLHQIVFMVGPDKKDKELALRATTDALKEAHFTKIVWHNADQPDELKIQYLDSEHRLPEKEYHVIYTKSMTHQSMLACYRLSGPLVGATGDQSFIEAIEQNKIVVYQTRSHKIDFINGYDVRLIEAANHDVSIKEMLKILRHTDSSNKKNYERLGALIHENKAIFLEANERVIRQNLHLDHAVFTLIQKIQDAHQRHPSKIPEKIFTELSDYSPCFYQITYPEVRRLIADFDHAVKSGQPLEKKCEAMIVQYSQYSHKESRFEFEEYLGRIIWNNPHLAVLFGLEFDTSDFSFFFRREAAQQFRSIWEEVPLDIRKQINIDFYSNQLYIRDASLDVLLGIVNQFKTICETAKSTSGSMSPDVDSSEPEGPAASM